jgi:Sel1 repeat
LVCSACGHESPAGNRFCGMCGTPLPHRPLSTPGAQGTINLTRGPLETASPDGHKLSAAAETAEVREPYGDKPAAYAHTSETQRSDDSVSQEVPVTLNGASAQAPVLVEAPAKQSGRPTYLPPSTESVPEDQLPGFVERLDDSPPSQAGETATTATTRAMQPNVSDFLDALAAGPGEPSAPKEAPHFPWMDDVLEQIELEAAKHSNESAERPRFLDLLGELSLPAAEPDPPASTIVTPTLAAASDVPRKTAGSAVQHRVEGLPGRKWRRWLAIAAVLVFAILGTTEWLSRRSDAVIGPLEFIRAQIRKSETSTPADANKDQSGASAGSAAPNTSNQAIQTQQLSKPQDQNAAAGADVHATAPATLTSVSPQDQSPPIAQDRQTASPTNKVPGEAEMTEATHARNSAAKSAWLWKATAKGNPEAPVQLAELYVRGDGVPRSCEQAVVLLKTAATRDNAGACNRLASMYADGTCVPRDRVEAYRWLSSALAADPNSQSTRQKRDLIWQQMTPEERALVENHR